ncbi:oligosaccharyl transferase subunit [Histoplasma capsulatum var. duboisii H88]|uniref:Dolichyl-diphosphooligosaccharide--protein glycosyltransferase subunit OST2 n=1 Tax=Ajellomyces capsulatus (strain H88) TaxID=544711 RepID=A0A8A1LRZ2_AJEC8|nr:oligosaccharyl transferase subunit [Histoplasma capsulatum var. duboisii H88]
MAPKRRVASSQPAANSSSPPTPSKTTLNPTSTQSHSAGASLSANSQTQDIVVGIWQRYLTQTPKRTLMLDSFMAFLLIVGGVQFLYCILAGNYPFNAFLSGFSAAVGQFVLTASLRMQTSHQGGKDGKPTSTSKSVSKPANGDLPSNGLSSERAFADYVFGSLILHFFCINFIN